MSRLPGGFSLALLPLLLPGGASADVYKYIDRGGHVYYTDNPNHSGYSMIIQTPAAFPKPLKVTFGGKNSFTFRGGRTLSSTSEKNRSQFAGLIDEAASRHGLDPALLHAVIRAESSYNPAALSNKGAIGLMQLMPATAARYGVDPYDPAENIIGGARYLSDLIEMFQSDIRLAVAAYNAGENNVIKYGNKVPPFQETQNYVTRVLGYYNRFN
jgi:soluble lytic murein transglycosylase-like protein